MRIEVVRRTSEPPTAGGRACMKMFTSPTGFTLVRCRWVVERTLAWLSHNRRLAKDCEGTIEASEGWRLVAAVRILTSRWSTAQRVRTVNRPRVRTTKGQ